RRRAGPVGGPAARPRDARPGGALPGRLPRPGPRALRDALPAGHRGPAHLLPGLVGAAPRDPGRRPPGSRRRSGRMVRPRTRKGPMTAWTLFLIALGVSADAFAVALGKGLSLRRLRLGQAAAIALTFGAFQALMPVIGWFLGGALADRITAVDHWVAFG